MATEREAIERNMAGARAAHIIPTQPVECNYQIMQLLGNGNINLISRTEHAEFQKGDFCVLVEASRGLGERSKLGKVMKASHLCEKGQFKGFWKTVVKVV